MQNESLAWARGIEGHIASVYPFFDVKEPHAQTLDFDEIVKRRRRTSNVRLDYTALATKVCNNFIFGDRTLIDGIQRAPWMARLTDDGQWQRLHLPPHGRRVPDPELFKAELLRALIDEVREYARGCRTVGLLLSGGMDSRVAAGVLRFLEMTDGAMRVIALTWGREESRDVNYARRIAQRFGWDSLHFQITPSLLERNIHHCAVSGAEVSPLHLHAVPDVAQISGLDAVIAASYGDSIGRGEFSGVRVGSVKPMPARPFDSFHILDPDFLQRHVRAIGEDARGTVHKVEVSGRGRADAAAVEQQQQMNYMRRMLHCTLLTIGRETPLYQIFTGPRVVGLMWGLSPKARDDRWYELLLNELPGNLLDIPWARTGKLFPRGGECLDERPRLYHQYGTWLRHELYGVIESAALSSEIRGLGLLNERALDGAFSAWRRSSTTSTSQLDELFAWLSALRVFLWTYNPDRVEVPQRSRPVVSLGHAMVGSVKSQIYIMARNHVRK